MWAYTASMLPFKFFPELMILFPSQCLRVLLTGHSASRLTARRLSACSGNLRIRFVNIQLKAVGSDDQTLPGCFKSGRWRVPFDRTGKKRAVQSFPPTGALSSPR
jgi:hypothetical protein